MGRQVSFYATTADEHALLAAAAALGCRVLPHTPRVGEVFVPADPLDEAPSASPTGYLLPAGVDVERVGYLPMQDGERLVIDLDAPVVELTRSRVEDVPSARPGRVYLSTPRAHPDYASASKVFNALARVVRSWPRLDEPGTFHVGPDALTKADAGDLPLVPRKVR